LGLIICASGRIAQSGRLESPGLGVESPKLGDSTKAIYQE